MGGRLLVTIDPGVHVAGVAFWRDAVLISARLLRDPYLEALLGAMLSFPVPDNLEVLVELPRVYARGKVNPNDLVDLSFCAGQLAGILHAPIRTVTPAQWKGQVPKKVMNSRVLARLSEEEQGRIIKPKQASLLHNVLDAIGIGMHEYGRLGR